MADKQNSYAARARLFLGKVKRWSTLLAHKFPTFSLLAFILWFKSICLPITTEEAAFSVYNTIAYRRGRNKEEHLNLHAIQTVVAVQRVFFSFFIYWIRMTRHKVLRTKVIGTESFAHSFAASISHSKFHGMLIGCNQKFSCNIC